MLSRLALGLTQLSIKWILGVFTPGVKNPEGDADYSPPTSAEVNKTWICSSTPPYAFMT
jgi:hypothetical protein